MSTTPTSSPTEPTEPTEALPVTEPTEAPAAPAEPLGQRLRAAQTGPTEATAAFTRPAPSAHVVDGVWSASSAPTPQTPRVARPWTLSWGVALVSTGLITLLIALGAHINLATAGIIVLGALGVLLLVLALLPQRGGSGSPQG